MKIIIIGSGVIGLTTAYCLNSRGHEVTVIDRRGSAGKETSFANGALLTPSMSEPWIAPGSWRELVGSIGRPEAPLQLCLRALPAMAGWGIQALRNSRPAAFELNTLRNLRLARYSLEVMQSLRQTTGIDYGRATRGTLRIFRDTAGLERAAATGTRLSAHGLKFRLLSVSETIVLEPALAPIAEQLVGSIHYPDDETGDAYRFCVGLSDYLCRRGVEFRFETEVSSIETISGRATSLVSRRERITGDAYVVAAGSHSKRLLQRAGVRLPVLPVKGYSISYASADNPSELHMPIVDDHLHAVVVPVDGVLRIAGTAEFAGFNCKIEPVRIENLIGLVSRVLPNEPLNPKAARPWCGLRAMSSDGVPIVSRTSIPNVFVNTGHGHLGWTMAAGSAQLLADLLCEQAPSIDPASYALARFDARSIRSKVVQVTSVI